MPGWGEPDTARICPRLGLGLLRVVFQGLVLCLLLPAAGWAEAAPVAVRVPNDEAWVGQRVPFYIEVRAPGSFAGTVSFDLPHLPGVLLLKIGSPVVGSEEREGQSWFIQTHEFALFSQRDGSLEVPSFPVRYACREGFVGPVQDAEAQVPAWSVNIRRPPGSEPLGFLITTEALDVGETWDPEPGPAEVGTIFKRTVVQRATQVSGMAFAPVSTTVPDGIRIYPGDVETSDQLDRGDFLGERRETVTYLMQKPGTFSLPALTYPWWNPEAERLESKTLPAVTFEVTPSAVASVPGAAPTVVHRLPWLVAILGTCFTVWRRRQLAGWAKRLRLVLNPPEREAARRLLRACRHDDAAEAYAAWVVWRRKQGGGFQPGDDLQVAVLDLLRVRYGPVLVDSGERSAHLQTGEADLAGSVESAAAARWNGTPLLRAFQQARRTRKTRASRHWRPKGPLPPLNPSVPGSG